MKEKDVNLFVLFMKFKLSPSVTERVRDASRDITQLYNRPIIAWSNCDKDVKIQPDNE